MKKIVFLAFILSLMLSTIGCTSDSSQRTTNNLSSTILSIKINSSSQEIQSSSNISSSSSAKSTQCSISNINFISSKIGFICLNTSDVTTISYTLFKTTDGGKNWAKIGNNSELSSTSFIDEKTGYGLITTSINNTYNLVKTINGGISWSSVSFLKDKNIFGINIVNSNVMFVSTFTGGTGNYFDSIPHIFRTVDGGSIWTEINLPADYYVNWSDFSWVSSQIGYVLCGGEPGAGNQMKSLYYTNNGGKTWAIKSSSGYSGEFKKIGNLTGGGYCAGIKFFANGIGYMGLSRGDLQKSVDNGVNFFDITNSNDDSDEPVPDLINSNEGYTIFNNNIKYKNGTLYHTIDGGKVWVEVTSNDYWKSILAK
jgi:photosystem II stability/assembly factor-like uncharacterized protein